MELISPIAPINSAINVRRAVRRLRWFKKTFKAQAASLGTASGIKFEIDDGLLTRVFVGWLRAFEANRRDPLSDRKDFVYFSAGLMLARLIEMRPVKAGSVPPDADPENPVHFWPEGYLYTAYCLSVCLAVIQQDFDERIDLAPVLGEIRTWQSFRENTSEDPATAIAFLDRFVGLEPNWLFPGLFRARPNQSMRRLGPSGGPAPSAVG
ncbi:MAG TPA: hypothetical protein VFJ18_02785 [Pararhizobium sp.]|nr:hypothetical protein [Pararhizobium sp.]